MCNATGNARNPRLKELHPHETSKIKKRNDNKK